MKLSREEIRRITVGAVRAWEEDGALCFSKVTEEETEAWRKAAEWILPNVRATTGIRLDFWTDSSFVRVQTAGGTKYEVLTDGLLSHRFTPDPENRTFTADLQKGGHRVTVVLPSHLEPGRIRSVEIEDGAALEPWRYDEKILFLGDSITQGWNADCDCLSFAYQVSLARNARSVIQGIGGAFFLPEAVTDFGFLPDTVFVAYGTNDFGFFPTLGVLGEKAEGMLSRVKELYGGARIRVITPPWRQDYNIPRAMGTFDECRETIRKTAERVGLTVVDGYALYPHRNEFMADELHPNDLGFAQYAAHLLRLAYKDET
ncbi:MAG: SGNH/GDSL hydrolase family protein [Ruminococcaceae bacterium]|nr:SGNH/GDSL hydrolase family protein [Oscillospiraceae bacterium]